MTRPTSAPKIPPISMTPNDKIVIPKIVSVKTFLGMTAVSNGSVWVDNTIPNTEKSRINMAFNTFSGIL